MPRNRRSPEDARSLHRGRSEMPGVKPVSRGNCRTRPDRTKWPRHNVAEFRAIELFRLPDLPDLPVAEVGSVTGADEAANNTVD